MALQSRSRPEASAHAIGVFLSASSVARTWSHVREGAQRTEPEPSLALPAA